MEDIEKSPSSPLRLFCLIVLSYCWCAI